MITVETCVLTRKTKTLGEVPDWTSFTGNLAGFSGLFLKTFGVVIFLRHRGEGLTWKASGCDYDGWAIEDYQPVNLEIKATPCGGE